MSIVIIKKKPYTREKVAKDKVLVDAEKLSIGSAMDVNGGTLKGLTFSEERLLMPYLLYVPAEDPTFMLKSNLYFDSIKVRIPNEGKKLEVGLEDDTKPLSKENMPLNIADYVLYRYCQVYKLIAKSLEEAKSNDRFIFYMYSEEDVNKKQNESNKLKVTAYKEYAKIADDELLVTNVIRLLSAKLNNLNPLTKELTPDVKQNILTALLDTNPAKFLEVVADKNLSKLAEVYEMIDKNIIEASGKQLVFEGEVIGNTPEEAATFLYTAVNSKKFSVAKARLEAVKTAK